MRLIPALDRDERAVRLAGRPAGRLALVLVATVLVRFHAVRWWWSAGIVLALLALFPRQRRQLLVPATLVWSAVFAPFHFEFAALAVARHGEPATLAVDGWASRALVVLAGYCAAVLAREFVRRRALAAPQGLCARRPRACLIAADVALLALVVHAPLGGDVRAAMALIAVVAGRLLWFVALSFDERGADGPRPTGNRFGTWLPFWMGGSDTITPVPKNGGALNRIEAGDDRELAITMLKGVKLLAWSLVLAVALDLLRFGAFGDPGRLASRAEPLVALRSALLGAGSLPTLEAAFAAVAGGSAPHAPVLWATLAVNFLEDLLALAVWGHVMVAVARLAGFRALRNTWRPLQARSIAEFWNRYFFYFKELLVEVFFYPAFLRGPKRHPRLRKFLATLAAAGGGNFIYHFLKEYGLIAERGLLGALWAYRAYAVYGLVLGAAIGLSQLRDARAKRSAWAPLAVALFYALVSITQPLRPLAEHGRFLAALLGLR